MNSRRDRRRKNKLRAQSQHREPERDRTVITAASGGVANATSVKRRGENNLVRRFRRREQREISHQIRSVYAARYAVHDRRLDRHSAHKPKRQTAYGPGNGVPTELVQVAMLERRLSGRPRAEPRPDSRGAASRAPRRAPRRGSQFRESSRARSRCPANAGGETRPQGRSRSQR
jgi:hypothetical protein